MSSDLIARIDIPLESGATLYFFVRPPAAVADRWWHQLYTTVTSYVSTDLVWERTPDREQQRASVPLSRIKTEELLHVLRSAPELEAQQHKTLQLAVRRMGSENVVVRMTFFRDLDN